jgi:tRNA (cmo5U34)-methyltransferase
MKSWTFETPEIAKGFDAHVREQLPWYDMVTDAVCYIIRNYLPRNGTIVDIGASTGNLIDKIYPLVHERNVDVVAIEKSSEMCALLNSKYEYKNTINYWNEIRQEIELL